MILLSKRLSIRSLNPSDYHQGYLSGISDPLVNRYLVSLHNSPITQTALISFIQSCNADPNGEIYGIWQHSNPDFFGTIRVHNISSVTHSADIGICLFNRSMWSQGYAFEALSTLLPVLQTRHSLIKINAGIYTSNLSSIKLFSSLGFKEVLTHHQSHSTQKPPLTSPGEVSHYVYHFKAC